MEKGNGNLDHVWSEIEDAGNELHEGRIIIELMRRVALDFADNLDDEAEDKIGAMAKIIEEGLTKMIRAEIKIGEAQKDIKAILVSGKAA